MYKQVTDHDFEDLAIVGWIFEVESLKVKFEEGKEQQCMVPVVYSNIKDPFRNHQDTTNKPYNNLLSSSNNNAVKQPSDPSSKPQPSL